MNQTHSITAWITEVQAGDPAAAEAIWTRFVGRVEAMSRAKLSNLPARFGDQADLAQTVFAAVFKGLQEQRFRQMESRDDLWQALALVT